MTWRLAVVACLLLVGCADNSPEEATEEATEQAPPPDSADPSDRYSAFVEARGLEDQRTPEDELRTVAANLCDNTVSDMKMLVEGLLVIEEERAAQRQALDEKATVVDAFCPQTRLQLDAAIREAGFEPPPPAE